MSFPKFKQWRDSVEKSLDFISEMYEEDSETGHITRWLLDFDGNPYSLCPSEYVGNCFGSPLTFEGLIHAFHHAFVDDGDVSFPVVGGKPQIVFVHKYESNFREYALNSAQKEMEKRDSDRYHYEITFLDNVYDFTKAFDEYRVKDLRRCFLWDARAHGLEFALKHYSEYSEYKRIFNHDWIKEINDETSDSLSWD